METLSNFNGSVEFKTVFGESRLKKAARHIERLPRGNMLDVGCGDGDWGLYWKGRGWDVHGVDVNRTSVARAREKGLEASTSDLNRSGLPFSEGIFDLIFAGEVIEHLVDTDGFLAECQRCCKVGGYLLITTPNLASLENRIRLLLGMYPIWVDYRLSGCGHVRAYTPTVLKRQLRDHGFIVTKHTGNWVPFIPQRFADDIRFPFLAVTGTMFPGLAMDIIMMARRDT